MNLEELRLKALLTLKRAKEKDKYETGRAQVQFQHQQQQYCFPHTFVFDGNTLPVLEIENVNFTLRNVKDTASSTNMVSLEGVSINESYNNFAVNVNNDNNYSQNGCDSVKVAKEEEEQEKQENEKNTSDIKGANTLPSISTEKITMNIIREDGEISDSNFESELEEGEVENEVDTSKNQSYYQTRDYNHFSHNNKYYKKSNVEGGGFGFEEESLKKRRRRRSVTSISDWNYEDNHDYDHFYYYNTSNRDNFRGKSKNYFLHPNYNNKKKSNNNNVYSYRNTIKHRGKSKRYGNFSDYDFDSNASASDYDNFSEDVDSDLEKLSESDFLDFSILQSYKSSLLVKLDETQVLSSTSEQCERELMEKLAHLKRTIKKCEKKRLMLEKELKRVENGMKRLETKSTPYDADITNTNTTTTATRTKTTDFSFPKFLYLTTFDTFKLSSLYKHFFTSNIFLSSFSFNHRPISPNIPFCSIELFDGHCKFSSSSQCDGDQTCPYQHFSNLRFETTDEVIEHFASLGVDRLKLDQYKDSYQNQPKKNDNNNTNTKNDVYNFINFILYSCSSL